MGRARDEEMEPDLLRRLSAVVKPGDTVLTLADGKPNEVVDIGPDGVWIDTERSAARTGAELVPAWMLNEAWTRLNVERSLSNRELIKVVRRSSAVVALLAQLPNVVVASSRPIVLRLSE